MKKYTEVESISDEVRVDNDTRLYFFGAPCASLNLPPLNLLLLTFKTHYFTTICPILIPIAAQTRGMVFGEEPSTRISNDCHFLIGCAPTQGKTTCVKQPRPSEVGVTISL